ncbi:hypothetical protein WBG78_00690 [Chryseolinea sp. T2]|uniref:hypothetical protein n=1 Tax=Chryseolinea sp. T2 TaxID=3129255 RepID=UPI00307837F3
MRLLTLMMVLLSCSAFAQTQDSVLMQDSIIIAQDSGSVIQDSTIISAFTYKSASNAPADTTAVDARIFDAQKLRELKDNPDLQYGVEATVGESLWQRFLRWLVELIEMLFSTATETNWGRFLLYALLLVAVVVIVLMILKVNAFQVFYGDSASQISHRTLEENIHEMDFDKLIQEALAQQDYRLGVRLLFLYALKMLSDKNHIHWEQGKTNADYVNELTTENIKKGFSDLNYYFEYAWYGHFQVTDSVYARVKQTFDEWRRSL